MKRIGDTLYFEPNERDEFFRGIKLINTLNKLDYTEDISHEEAHFNAIRRLGYEDKISWYEIERTGKKLSYGIAHVCQSIEDRFEICLAPRYPSACDFRVILSFKQLLQAAKKIKKETGDFSRQKLRQYFLDNKEFYVRGE